jgi:23S rRNA (cytosine1962-C5)-methyltransferase
VKLSNLVENAVTKRRRLLDDPALDAVRLFHGAADGLDGLFVEKFGPVLVVQVHEGRFPEQIEAHRPAFEDIARRLAASAVYLKQFVRDRGRVARDTDARHHDPAPWIGEPVSPDITIRENDLRLIVRPYDGFSTGLFLEHRDNRRRTAELARGRRVLNAFAYTCAFSVAAAQGGAASVASLDLSKRYLEWGKRNFAANGLALGGHWFFCSDVFDFYERARRQNRRFDLIILDPPTFSKSRRPAKIFRLRDELQRLASGAVERLDPGGVVFLSTNDRGLSGTALEAALHAAGGDRPCRIMERPSLPEDFHGDPDYAKAVLARFD